MGNISAGLRTIAMRRADIFCTVEKIAYEATEASVDDAVSAASACVMGDIDDDATRAVDVDELMTIIPEQADDEYERELSNVLASTRDIIGIDDIYGIEENDVIGVVL